MMAVLFSVLLFVGAWINPAPAEATAPARSSAWCTANGLSCPSGRPYALSEQCARAATILCIDANYTDEITYDGVGQNSCCKVYNPGVAVSNYGFKPQASLLHPLASDYPTKPSGALAGTSGADRVLAMNWDPSKGATGGGNLFVTVRSAAGDNYLSGHTPTEGRDFYVGQYILFTSNFVFPGDPKLDWYNYSGAGQCYDTKILFVYPPGSEDNLTGSHYDAGPHTQCGIYYAAGGTIGSRYADALAFRYGSVSGNYKHFPLCSDCSPFSSYQSYGPFQCATNTPGCWRDPHDTPTLGQVFRFDTNTWYWLEFRYKVSSADNVADGAVEAWINGTKIYSETNIQTCGSGSVGSCAGLGEFYWGAYHNGNDGPAGGNSAWNGQMVVDDLVISTAYIGPPTEGSSTPPILINGGVRFTGSARIQ